MDDRLGIVGTGAIATGLGRLAGEHHDVLIWARSENSAGRAVKAVGSAAQVATDFGALKQCALIVEAVAEDREVKAMIHRSLGELLPARSLIATTTSSLSVSELAQASGRPDRFAALHVFNPVEKMKLVELSFTDLASGETRARMAALCEQLGKVAVEVPDRAGFVVNRLLFPYLFEAVRMLERDGLQPDAIDTCMRLGAGHPMGPLALLDFVGLDVASAIGAEIGIEVPQRLHELVAESRLGRKAGQGFYSYGTEQRKVTEKESAPNGR